ncbi:MAG: hypothetical protein Q8916_05270 [Bacteroidota bacterium]|nr:hypothetical protein [Bacteroidota bacterium]MDP4236295.1 hypothetical protein [Bacteroidota bacterium]
MPTYPSPVALSDFQNYLKDSTTDTTILAFYQILLDTATERVYTYLDRDYTPGAEKTEVFFGNGRRVQRLNDPAGALLSWKYYDSSGSETIVDISEAFLMAKGILVVTAGRKFERCFEHRLTYNLPTTLRCPEMVKQVITEIAAVIFEESKQGGGRLGAFSESDKLDTTSDRIRYIELSARQKEMLAPYKRIAV